LIRPLPGKRASHELIIPKFVKFRAGYPAGEFGEYAIFHVSPLTNLITPLPDWLRDEVGYKAPSFDVELHDGWLEVVKGDPNEVYEKLGRSKGVSVRRGKRLKLNPGYRFEAIRNLIREGVLPYVIQPIGKERRREPKTTIELREKQARDYKTFLEYSACSVFAPGGAGKTFFGIYAGAALNGKKMVVCPRSTIRDQWEARVLRYAPDTIDEWEFVTYQWLQRRKLREFKDEYGLIIYDEIQHMPSNMGIKASNIPSASRIGLSATPWREDGNEDIIPALCGVPLGSDWETGDAPTGIIWLVDSEEEKYRKAEQLHNIVVPGRTMFFVYRLEVGHKLAKRLGIPFVHGSTSNQMEIILNAGDFIVSKVGDAGISLPDLSRIIEVDYLGGRMEAGQRLLRAMHAETRGEVHLILTKSEYKNPLNRKRLAAFFAFGVDLRVEGAE
jgi:hypothetical protein